MSPKPNGAAKTPENNPDAFLDDENEIREMENWLKQQGGGASNLLGVSSLKTFIFLHYKIINMITNFQNYRMIFRETLCLDRTSTLR
jgi:hypothetical protein